MDKKFLDLRQGTNHFEFLCSFLLKSLVYTIIASHRSGKIGPKQTFAYFSHKLAIIQRVVKIAQKAQNEPPFHKCIPEIEMGTKKP